MINETNKLLKNDRILTHLEKYSIIRKPLSECKPKIKILFHIYAKILMFGVHRIVVKYAIVYI